MPSQPKLKLTIGLILTFTCPVCGAKPGVYCTRASGVPYRRRNKRNPEFWNPCHRQRADRAWKEL